jgi:hypothetical protein
MTRSGLNRQFVTTHASSSRSSRLAGIERATAQFNKNSKRALSRRSEAVQASSPSPPDPPPSPKYKDLLTKKLGPASKRSPRCIDFGILRRILYPLAIFCSNCEFLEAQITSGCANCVSSNSRPFRCQVDHTSYAFPFPFSARERPPAPLCQPLTTHPTKPTPTDVAICEVDDDDAECKDGYDATKPSPVPDEAIPFVDAIPLVDATPFVDLTTIADTPIIQSADAPAPAAHQATSSSSFTSLFSVRPRREIDEMKLLKDQNKKLVEEASILKRTIQQQRMKIRRQTSELMQGNKKKKKFELPVNASSTQVADYARTYLEHEWGKQT